MREFFEKMVSQERKVEMMKEEYHRIRESLDISGVSYENTGGTQGSRMKEKISLFFYRTTERNMVPCNAVELTEFETVGPEISNFVFRGGKIHGTICMKNCRNIQFTDAKEKER